MATERITNTTVKKSRVDFEDGDLFMDLSLTEFRNDILLYDLTGLKVRDAPSFTRLTVVQFFCSDGKTARRGHLPLAPHPDSDQGPALIRKPH
jgi:hypothetical protein